ncbi:hypothetical protein Pint_35690 [Pistacia integerrima]|uniref:Uncharacterized protein n=1 Tax=Pistacia integerrima TaxID=434235 RepID=A0ACC0Y2H4_9ROSI|nr:hypothetical protein Pint_35690 [Pistacia integerrima]
MVLRCKGFSQEQQEPALNGLTQEVADLPLNSVNNQTPSQNDAQKSKGQKANGNKRANQIINFILIVNSYSYVNELEHFVKQINGLDIVAMDVVKDLVKVKGMADLTELRSYIKTELKKDVEIVIPTEVMVPVKKGNGTTKKKEKLASNIDKNDKDAGVTNKKDKGTAVSEKINGIAGVDEKHKGSATINEPDKDKNGGIKNRKDVDNDREMKSKTFKAIGGERNGGEGGEKEEAELKNKASDSAGGGNREEYGSSTIKLNPVMYYTQYDNAYGYWREDPPCHPVKYSNDPLQIFSDENPHSCSIM